MSVVIRDFDMPESCKECSFSDKEAWCLIPGDWRKRYYMPEKRRSEYCPLIELPPHGRLIDADTMFKDICDSINEMTAIGIAVDGQWLWCKLNDALENAPTIILEEPPKEES